MAGHLMPNETWQLIEPLLPKRPTHPRGGRPVIADRDVLTGIIFMLKTGISWEDMPTEMGCGCGMTCLRRLREWQRAGVWGEIQEVLQTHLREARRIDWSRVRTRLMPRPRHADLSETDNEQDAEMRLATAAETPMRGMADEHPVGFSFTGQQADWTAAAARERGTRT